MPRRRHADQERDALFHARQTDDEGLVFAVEEHLDVRKVNCSAAAAKALQRALALPLDGVLEAVGDRLCAKMEILSTITSRDSLTVVRIIENSAEEEALWWIYVKRV